VSLAGHELPIVRTRDELDAAWLQAALGSGPVEWFAAEQIGTGQMSESHRLSLAYADPERAGPATVVLKLASADSSSRATGVGLGIYAREVRFYRELAPRIGGPLADCHVAAYDDAQGFFTLLLEDVAPATAGDQIAACSAGQARLAMRELARLHAPVFEDRELDASEWLNRPGAVRQALVAQLLPGFLERYGDRIAAEHRALCERFAARVDRWLVERRPPLGLVHGDFRLDNLLFGEPGAPRPLTVVDWQTVGWGGAMADAAYFLGGSLEVELRRELERDLFEDYHEALRAQGVRGFAVEDCFTEYRRHAFGGLLMVLLASMIVERTERGDRMFMAMLARHAQQALDLESEALLDGGHAPAQGPPRPAGRDEHAHEPGAEQLWNESWYFDAVAADGSLGAYVRLGLYPKLGVSWYTAFVCGPGRPSLAVVDFAAPLPRGPDLSIATDALRAEHRCRRPLERFGVTLAASARSYERPAELLRGGRGGRGEPVALALALEFQTDGTPYAYRLTTRYEIPCRVNGEIRIGEEVLELGDARGQRDHSWGVRDWWSMDWMWSAVHLDDGAHVHAVELRLPNAPALGVGYVQAAGDGVRELERVRADEQLGADGLVTHARLRVQPPLLELDVEPLAFAPLRLVAPDGRVSHFPRAMCRVRCGDGRHGVGWMEWNINQRSGEAS
jgi:thiamine kinase-like enzyme